MSRRTFPPPETCLLTLEPFLKKYTDFEIFQSQGEVRSLQDRLQTRNQTIEYQNERIQTLESNCPTCQRLREALDEVVKDVKMSDDGTRDEMRKEITDSVRAELRLQVPIDLRRQIRDELEREFRDHHSDILAKNTSRIREQDRLLLEKDAQLEKARNAPTVDHAACGRRQATLESKITQLEQDRTMARGNISRLNNEGKQNREELKRAQTASENLRDELETIKADQRRAQNINPLQGKLTTCQRELESMKADRTKARDNCSTYSKLLSDLRKKYETLQNECAAFKGKSSLDGDSVMDDGRRDEAAALGSPGGSVQRSAQDSDELADKPSVPINGGEKSDDELEKGQILDTKLTPKRAQRFHRRLARQPTSNPVLGDGAGRKREHGEYSDGEADDEGGDDRKKVKIASIEDGMHRLRG